MNVFYIFSTCVCLVPHLLALHLYPHTSDTALIKLSELV